MAWGLWGRFVRGLAGFQRAFFNPELDLSSYATDWDLFNQWEPRRTRYQVLWSFYANTQFWDEVHRWSRDQKREHGLYRWTRPNFNPVARIVEFGATHILGGPLDKDAGDGVKVKSAIPIETESAAVRAALAQLWRDSRMVVEKDIISRKGCALGDIGIRVCDDPIHKRVTLKTVHPGSVKWVDRDWETGRLRGYQLEEQRYDPMQEQPRGPYATVTASRHCKYTEDCWIEGGRVHYHTYRNGADYDWKPGPDGKPLGNGPGARPEWDVPYGFVPLVLIQHMAVGLPWGLAETNTGLVKFLEMADVGSNIGDSVRRILNAPLYISGVNDPGHDVNVRRSDEDETEGNPYPGRTKQGIIYLSDPAASVQFGVQPIDVPGASAHVAALKDDMLDDYPEVNEDIWKSGDPSGKAIWIARQRPAAKIQQRRVGYDLGLEDAFKIALAIGGIRSYESYRGLGSEEPFNDEKLALSIAHRSVFESGPLDDIEERTQKYAMYKAGVDAGFPLPYLMEQEGEDPTEIAKVAKLKEDEQKAALVQMQQQQKIALADNGPPQ